MAWSNLVPYAFVWEKVKTMNFSETIVVYDIKVGRCSQLNEYMKLWVPKVRIFHLPCSRSLGFNIFIILFHSNHWFNHILSTQVSDTRPVFLWFIRSSQRLIMGKWRLHAITLIIDWNFDKLSGNQDRHKLPDEFEFWPNQTSESLWHGSHRPWKTSKTAEKISMHGKIMEFEK